MKKKILFFHFDLKGGGAEKVLVNLVNNMDKSKYDITVQTLFGVGTHVKELNKDIHFKYLFKKQFRGLPLLLRLFPPALLHRLIIRNEYDIEVAYLENTPTRIVSGCNNPKTKKIAWIHSMLFKKPKTYRSIHEMTECYMKFNKIVCVSNNVRESHENFIQHKNLPYCIVRNYIDSKHIINCAKDNVELINDGKLRIIFIGKLIESKGALRLLKLMHELFQNGYDNWHLYYLGIGEQMEDIKESIKIWNLQNIVTLLGYQDNPYKFIAKMDLYICASHAEGYCTAATEATILGIPSLTTNCGGMKEIYNNGEYGLIVDNTDNALKEGIRKFLHDPQLLSYYKSQAIKRASYFESQTILKENENLFDSILNE